MASAANVLRHDAAREQSFGPSPTLFGRVSNDEYRRAISTIVSEVQTEHDLDDEQLGECLGCSEGTIANARNKRGNLDPVTMLNLGAMFGGEDRLKRVLALVNGCPTEQLSAAEHMELAEHHLRMARKELE